MNLSFGPRPRSACSWLVRLTIVGVATATATLILAAAAGAASAYETTVKGDLPTLYWRLGEPPGTLSGLDSSGRGYSPSYGFGAVLGVPGAIDGDPDTALNGSANNADYATPTATAEIWLRVTTTSTSDRKFVGASNSAGDEVWSLNLTPQGTVYSRGPDSPTMRRLTQAANTVVDEGDWHHIVATFSGASSKIYVDGADVTTGSSLVSFTLRCPPGSPCNPFDGPLIAVAGNVDEFALYDHVLSVDRIVAHAQAGGDGPSDSGGDQSDGTIDQTVYGTPASATPMAPGGPVAPGSYTTELWDPDATEMSGGAQVVVSTSPGTFGLSGGVININTGASVAGAQVRIEGRVDCSGCTPGPGPVPVQTTSSSTGGFAFINIPPPPTNYALALVVTAPGFGSYELTHLQSEADRTYQTTVMLDTVAQSEDDSMALSIRSSSGSTTRPTTNSTLLGGPLYKSRLWIPPQIKVREFDLTSGCTESPTQRFPGGKVRFFRTRFYVLHVAAGEINGKWKSETAGVKTPYGQEGWRAAALWIQNYAWYHMLFQQDPTLAAVDNTTRFQCFPRRATVPTSYVTAHTVQEDWKNWIKESLKARIARGTDRVGYIAETAFSGIAGGVCGSESACYDAATCNSTGALGIKDTLFDTFEPQQGNQLGAKRADDVCRLGFRSIAGHYFAGSSPYPERTGTVRDGAIPPTPQMKYVTVNNTTAPSGKIILNFSSRSHGINVGWWYRVTRSPTGSAPWTFVCCKIPTGLEGIQTQLTYAPPADGRPSFAKCYYYRVRAWNPLGFSAGWARFTAPTSTNTVPNTNNREICPVP